MTDPERDETRLVLPAMAICSDLGFYPGPIAEGRSSRDGPHGVCETVARLRQCGALNRRHGIFDGQYQTQRGIDFLECSVASGNGRYVGPPEVLDQCISQAHDLAFKPVRFLFELSRMKILRMVDSVDRFLTLLGQG